MEGARAFTEDEKISRCAICGQWTWKAVCSLCGPVAQGPATRPFTVNLALTVKRLTGDGRHG